LFVGATAGNGTAAGISGRVTRSLGVGEMIMKKRIVVFAIFLGVLQATFGCAEQKRETQAATNLARAEVLQIAEATAKSEGYDVSKYNMTGCHYEFTRKDHTWTVFYELKPPAPPGGHFMVSIDDQTKKASLAHGE
jgi:hypothetical protein